MAVQMVRCPRCSSPLGVALEVQVEAGLREVGGRYFLGKVQPGVGAIRRRLEHAHCDADGALVVEADSERSGGAVVLCSNADCDFSGWVSEAGIE